MAKRRIFTVGLDLPGDDFECIEFNSDQTLLDGDIILFEPTLGHYNSYASYGGKPVLSDSCSFRIPERLSHWKSELIESVNAGKLVIIYLSKPVDCYRFTGQKQYSGTGRSRTTTNLVVQISSYEAVPNLKGVTAKSGTEMRLRKEASYLTPYWNEFSSISPYEVEIKGDFKKVLLESRTGERILGAAVHGARGTLIFIPPLRFDEDKFVHMGKKGEDAYWTKDGLSFGKRLAATLSALADTLKMSGQATPPPVWASESRFRLAQEGELEGSISKVTEEIQVLQQKKVALAGKLRDAGSLRGLLFEQGRPLEAAVLDALRLVGFNAETVADGESEFDAVFESPEGRCLGEAEGKDSKAINVDKSSQLERNLQEDFAREGVTAFAKGVLFGNAFRLIPLAERGQFFTEKCFSAAKRAGIALVRTPDLFEPAKYMKEHSADVVYAAQCRKAIFDAAGEVVVFPTVTILEQTSLLEAGPNESSPKSDSDQSL
jgi:hypothetical protein